MKQRKKQIGGRYLARVRGAFGKLRVLKPGWRSPMCPECGSTQVAIEEFDFGICPETGDGTSRPEIAPGGAVANRLSS